MSEQNQQRGLVLGSPQSDFATTQWSVVVAAGDRGQPEAEQALATLCERYWYPLYVYVRRRTPDVETARDLTQEFFAHLLEKNGVARARSERGRFRAFLLTSLRNFLVNEHERGQAVKRGGGQRTLSLDFESGESRLSCEPADPLTPERRFEREWTVTLLEHVLHRLEEELATAGKGRQFNVLKSFLAGAGPDQTYGDAAAQLEMTEEAVRQAAHRLRGRYREILRSEVARTVADPADVEDEIRGLLACLAD